MSTLLRVLLFGAITYAQFVTPPDDLVEAIGHAGVSVRYKQVPDGICELDHRVKSYSGFADIAEDQHIFWWFFEARNGHPEDSPLTIWINGGPGSSSMTGLFAELGPCSIDYFGSVVNNPYSWTNSSNMLFVDQPSQVGFSYSQPVPVHDDDGRLTILQENTCPGGVSEESTCGTYSHPEPSMTANSTLNAAPAFWKTLQGFTGVFPQYSKNGLHMATESYGGHFGPVFAAYIEQQNDLNLPGSNKLQLETLLVGNGWFDPAIQFQAFYNFTVNPGNTYDYFPFNGSMETLLYDNLYGSGHCLDQLEHCKLSGLDSVCVAADNFCMEHVEDMYHQAVSRDVYDIRELTPDPFPSQFHVDYLNTAKVQQGIGAYTNFSTFSHTVYQTFRETGDDAREVDTIRDIQFLLNRNITVSIYAGDADYDCNWIGVEAVAEEVMAGQFDEAGYGDLQTFDNVVHAQVKQSGRFSFTRVYESGHMVPFYQPLTALTIFDRAINGMDIQTGALTVDNHYLSSGSKKSTYREGNTTVQWTTIPVNVTYDSAKNMPGEPWTVSETLPTDSEYFRFYPLQNNSLGSDRSTWRLLLQYILYLFYS
ncbi:hypothetical protein PFICI_12203 [Pestalotiopsis fici W106-1]|uniref:Carboxypeptidase n=1 Tax=Pestalotiopsis fici (strain W106-1 / CGMCC3.15140) TaxID=1229662 RepID=W3WVF1_PESFW|nr:uncharacterized protein PFICI_12203 [Pestalotiopsis fici W106-1]ETS76816.1 hypothetical protein PFICI_12203 [Pestalotiopsis fici W106-1]